MVSVDAGYKAGGSYRESTLSCYIHPNADDDEGNITRWAYLYNLRPRKLYVGAATSSIDKSLKPISVR